MKHPAMPSAGKPRRGKSGKRSKQFSVVLAVKGNARTQVGQPPPVRILSEKTLERQQTKHKATLARQLADAAEGP